MVLLINHRATVVLGELGTEGQNIFVEALVQHVELCGRRAFHVEPPVASECRLK